jgi:hypothetical protein
MKVTQTQTTVDQDARHKTVEDLLILKRVRNGSSQIIIITKLSF